MLVQSFQDVVVGAMVELTNFWLLTMLFCQVAAVLIMETGQHIIFDGFDRSNSRHPIVEWTGCHKFARNLISLGSIEIYVFQDILSSVRGSLRMPAITLVCEPKILSTAVFGNELRTFLLRRASCVFHTNSVFHPTLIERVRVQLVHQFSWNWF